MQIRDAAGALIIESNHVPFSLSGQPGVQIKSITTASALDAWQVLLGLK